MADDPDGEGLERLLQLIGESRAVDFRGYKRASLERRIRKRMTDVGIAGFDDYRDHLETNTDEYHHLLDTILINVTGFFRDPRAWEYLRAETIPQLFERAAGDEVRVWSAGCSSGEEAYSLAIAIAEVVGEAKFHDQVKIYATDVDDDALRQARHGVYPAKALDALSPELRDRYFDANGDSYTFRPDLRRRVIYGRHDITRDAPISRLHLLACRNVLMYFNSETQNQILDRFHFALLDEGILFLGKAEMLLSDGERFEAIELGNRVFRRRPGIRGFQPIASPVVLEPAPAPGGTLRQRQLRLLALDAAPTAHLLVDTEGSVVLANNQARATFGLTTRDVGRPLRDLEISYRPVDLRTLIDQALAERRSVRLTAVERSLGPEERQYLDVEVQPVLGDDGVILGVDVTFTDVTTLIRLQEDVKRSREDLETAYEELQSTNEELETTNEELQSSIEELETTNEELQSTNEELETTNEELQSTNEELETMNEELRTRTGELDDTAGFLHGILASVPIALVVLDRGLRVTSWNAAATALWGLRPNETERQLFFALDFGLPTSQLREPVRDCIDTGTRHVVAIEAVSRLGRKIACTVTVAPLDTEQAGVVLSMDDRNGA